ncbi:MAG: DNA strand exchange inhibitor protein [Planctomycetes bacterium]|nr:DNA strand exchange inhibitor protein [Planctomycetota bacterium]
MDEQTLNKLEFDHITAALVQNCACSLGQALARKIKPSAKLRDVRHWLAQVGQMITVEVEQGLPPLGGMRDIRPHVEASGKPAALEPEALCEVQATLAGTGVLCRWFESLPPEAELLSKIAHRVTDLTAIAHEIDQAIDSRGAVRDTASPKLETLRGKIEATRARIASVFERILKQPRYLKVLQYPKSTFHNDRVVLPLKAEYRGHIPGIIHRSSDSGATVFVEPSEVVELNNAIAKLRIKEHEEITRILLALTRLVHRHADEILTTLEAVSVLDLISAKVKYARTRNAICPEIGENGILDLREARHPVLVDLFAGTENRVVPIDIRLGEDFDVLVVTGPNTGGKTVVLKTVGLLAAMAQAGIPIPVAEGSVLPVYERIFIDIGDEQSLEQSLSTFSGHLANIRRVVEEAGPRSLVLIDELGAGTDPDEGSAIGWAVMDELLALGCSAVLTTHLSQLKAAAYTTERVDNASVEFDVESLRPTYVLRLGEPGNSNAIAIAQRLGLPSRVIKRAKGHLDDQHRSLSKAIEGTLEARRGAEQARKAATQAQLEAKRSQASFEQKERELRDKRAAYEQWLAWLNNLRPGDPVHVATFGKTGTVVRMQLHKQSALVSIGAIDHEVQLRVLAKPVE